jgi:hypothetical protein
MFSPHMLICEPCFFPLDFLMCLHAVYVRGNWEISRRDLNSAHLVSMVPTDQNNINSNYDQYSTSSSESLIWCRSVAVIVISLTPFLCTCAFLSSFTIFLNLRFFSCTVHGSAGFKTYTSPHNYWK